MPPPLLLITWLGEVGSIIIISLLGKVSIREVFTLGFARPHGEFIIPDSITKELGDIL